MKRTEIVEIMQKMGCALVATSVSNGTVIDHFLNPDTDVVVELESHVAVTADCGCVYHAEQGIPCQHDLQLSQLSARPIARWDGRFFYIKKSLSAGC